MSAFSDDLVEIFSLKTKIKPKLVIVILEIFVFIIKRILIDDKSVYLTKLGSFRIELPKTSKWRTTKYLRFRPVNYMKSVLSETNQLTYNHSCDKKLKQYFIKIAPVLGLKYDEVKYLFNLFFYYICLTILKKNRYKLNRFGEFYVIRQENLFNSKLYDFFKKKKNKEINCKVLKFRTLYTFKKEINKKVLVIKVSPRVKRLLYNANISNSIEQI
jgi:nucleoid DNA-binding protein